MVHFSRMRVLAVVLVLSGLLSAAFAPRAGAAPRLRALAVTANPARETGAGLVAVQTATGVVAFAASTGRRFDVVRPDNCSFASSGGGQALWSCPLTYGLAAPVVTDLRTGKQHRPDTTQLGFPETLSLDAVGTRWVTGVTSGYHYQNDPFYLDWHTSDAFADDSLNTSPTVLFNLDSTQLVQSLCSPLTRRTLRPRTADDPYEPPLYAPFDADGRFGLDPGARRLRLQRCGSRRATLLSSCRAKCVDARMVGGWVTWREGRTVNAYAPVGARRLRWRVAAGARLARTPTRLIVSVPLRQRWRLLVAKLPRPVS
jgi:hypothetical protein